MDAIFARADQATLPGAAVAIAVEGVPVYRKGFGLANMELPAPLTPSMRMRIGSTTKHFAVLAYLLLCEEGKAGIDDEIGVHLPEIHEISRHVTVRQLMSHTSGLRDYLDISMQFQGVGRPISDAQMLAAYRTVNHVNCEPQTQWNYNNGGYVMLSIAIERLCGAPFDQVLRKRILDPVGMRDTMLRRWDSDFVENSATLHTCDAKGNFSRTYMGMELSGAGGMVSTMDDMLRWLRHMDAPKVGSTHTWALMREPQRLVNGTSTAYGLGLRIERHRGVNIVHHRGGVLGGNSQMLKVPAAALDISIAVNRSDLDASALTLDVVDACIEGLDPLANSPPPVLRTGTFVSRKTGRVAELSVAAGVQMMSLDGSLPMVLSEGPDGLLRPPETESRQRTVAPSEGARPHTVALDDYGSVDMLQLLEIDKAVPERAVEGIFEAVELGMTVQIVDTPSGPSMTSSGPYGSNRFALSARGAGIWVANSVGAYAELSGILTFAEDGSEFFFSTERTISLAFRRVGGLTVRDIHLPLEPQVADASRVAGQVS